jgi:hypothetical protein
MPALPFKHLLSIVLSILIIFTLFITSWRIPQVGMALGLIFLLFSLTATSYTIIKKNRKAYMEGKLSLFISIKNTGLEISAILFAMASAGLIGRYISTIATGNISSHPLKLITGVGIGILVGWGIGLLMKLASSRVFRSSTGSEMPALINPNTKGN